MKTTIEQLVQARDVSRSIKQIKIYLKEDTSFDAIRSSVLWLRRLGKNKQAYQLLKNYYSKYEHLLDGKDQLKLKVLLSYTLTVIGANKIALRFVNQNINHELLLTEDIPLIARIYLVNSMSEDAVRLYQTYFSSFSHQKNDKYYIEMINYTDALFASGERVNAREMILSIKNKGDKPITNAIILTALGEYLCRDGKFEEAFIYLQEAEVLMNFDNISTDYALLAKWLAVVCGNLGKREVALKYFDISESILSQTTLTHFAWIKVLELKRDLKLTDENTTKSLKTYPVKDIQTMIAKDELMIIDFSSNECFIDRTWKIGITQELKLLALVVASGNIGITFNHLKDMLWQSDFTSILLLDDRLRKTITTLQNKFHDILDIHNERVFLNANWCDKISVIAPNGICAEDALPSIDKIRFLKLKECFTGRDFCNFYGLKRTQANAYLKQLTELKLIVRTGDKFAAKYMVQTF